MHAGDAQAWSDAVAAGRGAWAAPPGPAADSGQPAEAASQRQGGGWGMGSPSARLRPDWPLETHAARLVSTPRKLRLPGAKLREFEENRAGAFGKRGSYQYMNFCQPAWRPRHSSARMFAARRRVLRTMRAHFHSSTPMSAPIPTSLRCSASVVFALLDAVCRRRQRQPVQVRLHRDGDLPAQRVLAAAGAGRAGDRALFILPFCCSRPRPGRSPTSSRRRASSASVKNLEIAIMRWRLWASWPAMRRCCWPACS